LILPPCVISFHRPGLASVILADGQAGWVALWEAEAECRKRQ
jgi:hypothetical protein